VKPCAIVAGSFSRPARSSFRAGIGTIPASRAVYRLTYHNVLYETSCQKNLEACFLGVLCMVPVVDIVCFAHTEGGKYRHPRKTVLLSQFDLLRLS